MHSVHGIWALILIVHSYILPPWPSRCMLTSLVSWGQRSTYETVLSYIHPLRTDEVVESSTTSPISVCDPTFTSTSSSSEVGECEVCVCVLLLKSCCSMHLFHLLRVLPFLLLQVLLVLLFTMLPPHPLLLLSPPPPHLGHKVCVHAYLHTRAYTSVLCLWCINCHICSKVTVKIWTCRCISLLVCLYMNNYV